MFLLLDHQVQLIFYRSTEAPSVQERPGFRELLRRREARELFIAGPFASHHLEVAVAGSIITIVIFPRSWSFERGGFRLFVIVRGARRRYCGDWCRLSAFGDDTHDNPIEGGTATVGLRGLRPRAVCAKVVVCVVPRVSCVVVANNVTPAWKRLPFL